MRLGVLLPASLLISAAAPEAEPAVRQPTSKWQVDFREAQCVATRSYGTAEDPLFLVLKAPPIGKVMQVAVMRKGGFTDAEQLDATVATDQRPPRETSILMFGPRKAKLRVYVLNMPDEHFQEVRKASSLTIRTSGLNEAFALSQMAPLLKTLDQCVADLRQVWNVSDPEGEQSTLRKRATANIASMFENSDYPSVALRSNQSGAVRFALLVDEKGKVADCTVIETSGVPSLDAQSCAMITQKGRFAPAVGADGMPAKDAKVGRVRWVMPDD